MKSYFRGFITGGIFVLIFMVLIGQSTPNKKRIVEYIIIEKPNAMELNKNVNFMLRSGFIPKGGLAKTKDKYSQAMIKYNN